MFTRQHWPYLAAFFVSAILLVILLVPLSTNEPYSYDSADYMYAGKRGFLDNYTDAGTLSLSEFISYGLELRRNPESVRKFRDSHDRVRILGFTGIITVRCMPTGLRSEHR